MILKILLGLAAAFALFWTLRTKKIFPAVITLGMIVGILFAFCPVRSIQLPGIYIYMVFVAMAFVYAVVIKDKSVVARIVIALMSVATFAFWLWVLNHWHGNVLLAPIVVLLVGLAGIISRAKLKNELGFLVIMAVDAITLIIENWMKTN